MRWSCKEIAFDDENGYNHQRSIFFDGVPTGEGMYHDNSGLKCTQIIRDEKGEAVDAVKECQCSSKDLIRAPEDILVERR